MYNPQFWRRPMIGPSVRVAIPLLGILVGQLCFAQTREEKVRADRKKVEAQGFWIYNNLDAAFATAKETGKPLLVVLRCIPCEECVKLDDELLEQDPIVRPLLDKFVCARVVSTNGLDLSLFQFDTDQSFAVFLLNADQTIYGRFGTRSHRTEWLGDVSLKGLAAALQGALELHAKYPGNRDALAGKRGPQPDVRFPEKFPLLSGKYQSTLNYSGDVVKSCIHCHQIGDAQRDEIRQSGRPMPDSVLFPYPHPKSIGLVLNPDERATVKEIVAGSYAAAAGIQAGDVIERMNGQPLLSIADVQWILHRTSAEGGKIALSIRRDGAIQNRELALPDGWRQAGDITWRVSSWGMRRMTTGGMVLETASDEVRARAQVPDGAMALIAKHVGQYGEHAAAKNAGFRVGDLVLEFDGRSDLLREADLFRHAVTQRKAGDRVPVTIWRDGAKKSMTLPMQK
jgi:hypothetical protein